MVTQAEEDEKELLEKLLPRLPSNGMETKERRWKISSRLWLPLLAFAALLYIMAAFQSQYSMIPVRLPSEEPVFEVDTLKGFLIKTPGCRIPYMDPFDHTVKKYIQKKKPPVCNNGVPALFDSNLTSIFLVESSVRNYTDLGPDGLRCCYQTFSRAEPKDSQLDNKFTFAKKCVPFNGSVDIADEFVKVECHENRTIIYTDFFSFVPRKVERVHFERRPFNVLVIGLDGVSRLNLHRQLPKTVDYLKNISGIELMGYNKVGDNTFPNLIPVLTGLSEQQLEEKCWKNRTGHFDKCHFIWNDYKSRGFVTSFGEDSSWMGVFNYMRKGFKKQPTDYMWGPFNRISEREIGNSHYMNVYQCVGARQTYKTLLDHIGNFVTRMDMEDQSYFAFYWGASLSHDNLNKPGCGDKTYRKFFRSLKRGGHLDNTVMVFMSDHGIRWGGIRKTYQGQIEERLPFVFVVLPEHFKVQYHQAYKGLLKNTRRLTTPFDLHETLRDLVDTSILIQDSHHDNRNESRGYSLFTEIPPTRSCQSAEIASHWCTCQEAAAVETNNTLVQEAATHAVDFMNQQLGGYAQCANLTVNNITDARMMTYSSNISHTSDVKDYMIIFETIPGHGVFESTLRLTKGDDRENQFEVMGTISRLNLYGKQSACITDFHLKLYCYCRDLLGLGR